MTTAIKTPVDRALRHPEKAHRPDNPIPRKPSWIRVKAPTSAGYAETRRIVREHGLATVCEEAGCPNIGECWGKRHATMMILGSVCTRACAFCNVATGRPDKLDPHEPDNVARAVAKLGLEHVVITSVDRDDLDDGGAAHFAAVIRKIRLMSPGTTVEVLTPDFLRKPGALEIVVDARPDVFNHNLETVPRLYLTIRVPATITACASSTGSSSSTPRCSRNRGSWSVWARPVRRSCRSWTTCAAPMSISSRSGNIFSPRRSIMR